MARRAQPFNVIIQGRRLEVGDTLKRYAERKLRKLSRHLDQLREAQVVLEVERQRSAGRTQVAEVTVWGDGLVLRGTRCGRCRLRPSRRRSSASSGFP